MHFSAAIDKRSGSVDGAHDVWLLCRTGSSLCALPLVRVVEIMRVLPMDIIAGAPSFVLGLSIIRGAPTPIVDTALLFGGRTTAAKRLVSVRVGARLVALAVDEVLGVRSIERDADPLPPLLREAAGETISAIGRLDAELLLFLSMARIVPEDLFERLDVQRSHG
jgi:purine-binding chemotaxis protein CheW